METMESRKHPGAVDLGRRRMAKLTDEEKSALGTKAANRRAKVLTKARRQEIAKKAAAARWGKKTA